MSRKALLALKTVPVISASIINESSMIQEKMSLTELRRRPNLKAKETRHEIETVIESDKISHKHANICRILRKTRST